jgi:hypothetical protein
MCMIEIKQKNTVFLIFLKIFISMHISFILANTMFLIESIVFFFKKNMIVKVS